MSSQAISFFHSDPTIHQFLTDLDDFENHAPDVADCIEAGALGFMLTTIHNQTLSIPIGGLPQLNAHLSDLQAIKSRVQTMSHFTQQFLTHIQNITNFYLTCAKPLCLLCTATIQSEQANQNPILFVTSIGQRIFVPQSGAQHLQSYHQFTLDVIAVKSQLGIP